MCQSIYTDTFYDWISNVTFNTINNNSGSVGYEDFTEISTDVEVGSTYPISITISVNGNYEQHGKVWVDWNQDCIYDDDAEGYYLGQTNGTDTLTIDILVPEDALTGPTTMHISEKWAESPSPCSGGAYGETEDYTINVVGPPEACMTAVPVSGEAPLSVEFTDCSLNVPLEWNWDFGDGMNSGEQNPMHIYQDPGIYSVTLIVTNEIGVDTITNEDYIEILITGINVNPGTADILVYPNPASDQLRISAEGIVDTYIYSINGQLLIKKEDMSSSQAIDIRGLGNGNYIIKVISNKTAFTTKLNVIK